MRNAIRLSLLALLTLAASLLSAAPLSAMDLSTFDRLAPADQAAYLEALAQDAGAALQKLGDTTGLGKLGQLFPLGRISADTLRKIDAVMPRAHTVDADNLLKNPKGERV